MSKLISTLEAVNFPLLKDYEFNGTIYTPGERKLLSQQNRDFYEEINFINGELSILPKIKILFEKYKNFTITELEEEIIADEKLNSFLGKIEDKNVPVHYYHLQRYEEEGIIWCKRDVNPKRPVFHREDFFCPGALYSEIRVKI